VQWAAGVLLPVAVVSWLVCPWSEYEEPYCFFHVKNDSGRTIRIDCQVNAWGAGWFPLLSFARSDRDAFVADGGSSMVAIPLFTLVPRDGELPLDVSLDGATFQLRVSDGRSPPADFALDVHDHEHLRIELLRSGEIRCARGATRFPCWTWYGEQWTAASLAAVDGGDGAREWR
jgi:hypothetical protein